MRTCVSTRLKVCELRDICVGMGISSHGTKKELLKRINEYTNSPLVDDTMLHTSVDEVLGTENNDIENRNYREFRNIQDREFEECLRCDKLKNVTTHIENGEYTSISITDLKLYLDSKYISYSHAN